MANHIMIDMETLSTDVSTVILTIGAVRFDPRGVGVMEKLELRPTMEEQTEVFNRTISDDTLRWWGEQSPEAIEEAMGDRDRISYKEAMEKLYQFCWNRADKVWSNGSGFDIVIAESAFRDHDMKYPWQFWNVRDCRTIYDLAGVSLKDGGHVTSHKAVEDAERQDKLLAVIKHIPASMRNVIPNRKHPTGVYITDIPHDPVNDMAALHYVDAEKRGYFKLDLLNVHVYEQVRDEAHLIELMNEPDWTVLKERAIVEKLIHLGNSYDLIQRMPEPIDSIPRLAMFLAAIRPAKRHLIGRTCS